MVDRSKVQDLLRSILDATKSISLKFEATHEVFLHKDGDNTTGLSWEHAYNDFALAVQHFDEDLDDLCKINFGPGEWDLNSVDMGDRNMHLHGVAMGASILTNRASGATEIIHHYRYLKTTNLVFSVPEFIDCIRLEGSGANHSNIENVLVVCDDYDPDVYYDGFSTGLNLYNVDYVTVKGLRVIGEQGTTDALRIQNSKFGYFENVQADFCEYCAYLTSGSDENYFIDNKIHRGLYGINIGTGANNNVFDDLRITDTITDPLVDDGIGNVFTIKDAINEHKYVYPKEPTDAVMVTGGTNADEVGNWITLMSNPSGRLFKPIGLLFTNPGDNNSVHYYELGYEDGRGVHKFHEGYFYGGFNGMLADDDVRCKWLKAGTKIHIRMSTDDGGNDTVDVFLKYLELGDA